MQGTKESPFHPLSPPLLPLLPPLKLDTFNIKNVHERAVAIATKRAIALFDNIRYRGKSSGIVVPWNWQRRLDITELIELIRPNN